MTTIFTYDAAALDGLWYSFKKGDGSSPTIDAALYTDEAFGVWAEGVIADENADDSTKLYANQYSDSMLAFRMIELVDGYSAQGICIKFATQAELEAFNASENIVDDREGPETASEGAICGPTRRIR